MFSTLFKNILRYIFKPSPINGGGFFIYTVIGSVAFLMACNSSPSFFQTDSDKIKMLQQLVKNQPDSTLKLIDALLKDSVNNSFNSKLLIDIYTIKKEANRQLMNSDAVYENADKIIELAASLGDTATIAENILELNSSNVDFKYLKKAEKYLPSSIHFFQSKEKKYEEAICKLLYGSVLDNSGELKTAQKLFLEVYDIFGSIDSFKAQSKVCISIAGLYADIGSMEESSKYYRTSYEIARKYNDSIRQSVALSNLGINYRRTKPDSALLLYKQALALLPYNATYSRRMKVEFNMANLYLDQQKYDKAVITYNKVLEHGLKNNSSEAISIAYNGLAAVKAAEKNFDGAIQYYQKALKLMDSLGQVTHVMLLLPEMIALYKQTNDLPKVVSLYERKIKMNDSLLNTEKQIAVHELEAKYKTEKKELENKALKNRIWNIQMYILLFSIAIVVFFVLWKQRIKLMHERAISFEILMAKYRAEKEVGEKHFYQNKPLIQSTESIEPNSNNFETLLFNALTSHFENTKPYLNAKLKLDEIAIVLNTTQKDINKVLKDNNIVSFYAFVNEYRVNEARRLFEDPIHKHLKLDAIGELAGFGTRQTFYSAFMQFTGVNPGYYRKNILGNFNE